MACSRWCAGDKIIRMELMVFILLGVCLLVLGHAVEKRSMLTGEDSWVNPRLKPAPKHTIKTIKNKDGDIVDCVDINKQPAFSHPMSKNHTLQMRPSSYPEGMFDSPSVGAFSMIEINKNDCPPKTIPILRAYQNALSSNAYHDIGTIYVLHNASYSTKPGKFVGAKAYLNVYGPERIFPYQSSSSQLCIQRHEEVYISEICVGWMVNPSIFGDTTTRLFASWTHGGYEASGCINDECDGFFQISSNVSLGSILSPLSKYGGDQRMIIASITKDDDHNWWIAINNELVGLYPFWLFNAGLTYADTVHWGGFTSTTVNLHSPPMGSGHFAAEGDEKACAFTYLQLLKKNQQFRDLSADELIQHVSNPECYTVSPIEDAGKELRKLFYFGGPGGYCNS